MTRGQQEGLGAGPTPAAQRSKCENPELYAVFPFRIYGVGKPDLQLALDTFNTRLVASSVGWHQDDTQAAMLGLAALRARLRDGPCAEQARGQPLSGLLGSRITTGFPTRTTAAIC